MKEMVVNSKKSLRVILFLLWENIIGLPFLVVNCFPLSFDLLCWITIRWNKFKVISEEGTCCIPSSLY